MVQLYQMSFDGEILERGFWLYLWRITSKKKIVFYVGRTGDSSSPHASSPFNRIGQHLDFRPNAKGNSLAKRLKEAGIDPKSSQFSMLALGPLFPEQSDFEEHKPFRDQMATFEHEVAKYLRSKGLIVLGVHHQGIAVNPKLLAEIIDRVSTFCA